MRSPFERPFRRRAETAIPLWILESGFWVDTNFWVDTDFWKDV